MFCKNDTLGAGAKQTSNKHTEAQKNSNDVFPFSLFVAGILISLESLKDVIRLFVIL